MKRRLPKVALLLLAAFVVSCAPGKRWYSAHPSYRESPKYKDPVILLGLHDAVVVTRDKWFAKHLEMPRDSVYLSIGSALEENFKKELRNRYASLSIWPDSVYSSLPEETQKLDERIYIKGRFPIQGKPLRDKEGKPAPYIILIHEFTFGLDLSRDNFFDYALINNESSEQRTSKNLTVILSYTLWDNLKQRPLYSSVAEIQRPIPHDVQISDIPEISKAAADTLISEIDKGVR
ncbi:MAG: hypothetical protein WCR04_12305 [Fibrobacteraceae bacterium]